MEEKIKRFGYKKLIIALENCSKSTQKKVMKELRNI